MGFFYSWLITYADGRTEEIRDKCPLTGEQARARHKELEELPDVIDVKVACIES